MGVMDAYAKSEQGLLKRIDKLEDELVAKTIQIIELKELCRDLAGWIAYTTLGGKITAEEYAGIEDRLHDAGIKGE